jgi:hypothetical protein
MAKVELKESVVLILRNSKIAEDCGLLASCPSKNGSTVERHDGSHKDRDGVDIG